MALPNPLPDNPLRWEGWRDYNSDDLYARLCLSFDANPTNDQIEDNCRQLLVWWQKKLPLKNQPSNPMSQMLRTAMDEAPQFLAEARTKLLDPATRATHDTDLKGKILREAVSEFRKVLPFAIVNGQLTPDSEARIYEAGAHFGLGREEMTAVIDEELERTGAKRVEAPPPPEPQQQAPAAGSPQFTGPGDPAEEFRRMLRLSRLALDGDDMTDDQRDAMCNMGESLGLTGGQAEDLIDEYLEYVAINPDGHEREPMRTSTVVVKPAAAAPKKLAPAPAPVRKEAPVAPPLINTSAVARVQERAKYPNFQNTIGLDMLLVTSGVFFMGSEARDAAPHEQPTTQTTLSCYHLAKFPITNAQYEQFDPAHRSRRAPWADDHHPVVYVNTRDAAAFCQWLSSKEGRKYRLPTEAEWEYAARGGDGRAFPWGDYLDAGHYANFADCRTNFAWRDPSIDDGYAETAPVGSYPKGVSPFGVEDLAGNVFEWCLDYFDTYRGKSRTNPRGPQNGSKRVYRGGSWKSRGGSLRASARAFNDPDYSSNDVGFRIVCECG